MKESTLRKYHSTIGMILVFFVVLQVGSGVLLILNNMVSKLSEKSNVSSGTRVEKDSGFDKILTFIHFRGGSMAGGIYRIIIGLGLLCVGVLGITIFFMIQARTKK